LYRRAGKEEKKIMGTKSVVTTKKTRCMSQTPEKKRKGNCKADGFAIKNPPKKGAWQPRHTEIKGKNN